MTLYEALYRRKCRLPLYWDGTHFHVSQLRKCVHDPLHIISYEPLDIQPDLTYEEVPVRILDHKAQQLRTKTIPLVKVL
jgi:hypothetical protein